MMDYITHLIAGLIFPYYVLIAMQVADIATSLIAFTRRSGLYEDNGIMAKILDALGNKYGMTLKFVFACWAIASMADKSDGSQMLFIVIAGTAYFFLLWNNVRKIGWL